MKISEYSDLYALLNIFLKIKNNLLRNKQEFLCEEFFQCELEAIDCEISKIREKIRLLN